ncbi:MAG: Ethanolamine ammonia-lyase light chain [Firmicutes bacterium ADurb.Bin182]|nr:MAG: Ethanolamine ammonia-lyase light chain [Firmicutes bacterium ADurb.Bin182]
MTDQRIVDIIVEEILARSGAPADFAGQRADAVPVQSAPLEITSGAGLPYAAEKTGGEVQSDITAFIKESTAARVCIGKAGPRLKTGTLLKLRADHAAARDAVFKDVDESILKSLGLFMVQTRCANKNEFLTRPDLGRVFDDENIAKIKRGCSKAQVQIYVSDGLSSSAVTANLKDILPVILDGLKASSISAGAPFFVKYGRVHAMDAVSEALECDVVCVLIGERPGLITSESMSAYIAYHATVGMPEARRTVVSNIHANGLAPVEAGAYIVDVIRMMLEVKASGVDLRR